MRTNKALKNIFYSVFSYGSLFILSLILRKVFLKYIDIEYLGLDSVFENMFSLMALVDVGTGSLISYLLYKAFSENNRREVSVLMSMYKKMYLFIAVAMGIISIFLIPLLPILIKSKGFDWNYIIVIYLIRGIAMVGSYCFSYRRLLFKVDQCEYVCTKIDTITNYFKYLSWFIVIIATQSYIAYLIIQTISVFVANIIIARMSYTKYPYSKEVKVSIPDFRERNFFMDMKNVYMSKIAGTIFGSTNSLVLSSSLGVKSVAMLANYTLISEAITAAFSKIFSPLQGSIGNYVYSEDKAEGFKLFRMFELLSFIIGSTVSICFANLINPFISIWIGEKYVLSLFIVILISMKLYIGFASHFVSCYREVFGRFEIDRFYNLGGALLSLFVSIMLVNSYGIAGVYIGTIIGMLGFWIGRYKVLKEEYFGNISTGYIKRQLLRIVVLLVGYFITFVICSFLGNGIIFFIAKLFVCISVISVMNYIIYRKTEEFQRMLFYFNRSKNVIINNLNNHR